MNRNGRFGLSQGQYWRSLEEFSDSPEFETWVQREFPENASEWTDPVGRRRFLKLMAASLALAGVTACTRQPPEKVVPYVRQPEDIIPGKPLFFATAMPLAGYGTGLLVESHEGRPTKVEGNPDHPASLGSTDVFNQASVLTLYDPDRPQTVTNVGDISTWSGFVAAVRVALDGLRPGRGAGLRILTETVTSPTLTQQINELLTEFPAARWHQYETAGRDNARMGSELAFGEQVNTIYRLENADVVLALEADFLSQGPGCLRYAREFAIRRRVDKNKAEMSRLYAVESTPTNTGASADHRIRLKSAQVEMFALALAGRVGLPVNGELPAVYGKWIGAVADDLQRHRGSSLVIPGDHQPPVVHAIAHAINSALGNAGKTIFYTELVESGAGGQLDSLRSLVSDIDSGAVQLLLIVGGNPVYTAPADFRFAERLAKIPLRAHLSLYYDETSELCHWHIPEAHYLESWSDTRAFDGTASIIQPLISPLYGSKTAHELIAALSKQPEKPSYQIVRDYWKTRVPAGEELDRFWRTSVHNGIVAGTAATTKNVSPQIQQIATAAMIGQMSGGDAIEVVFKTDPSVFDGRFANNGWLQELPRPITKLTWDNALLISPETAHRLGVNSEDVVSIRNRGNEVNAPVLIVPGQADNSLTAHLGFGRTRAGSAGTGVGFNAYSIRSSEAPWIDGEVQISLTGSRFTLATTQLHHNVSGTDEGRGILRTGSLAEYQKDPSLSAGEHAQEGERLSLYPEHKYEGNAWGMAIDLNACIGCNACVIACQAENNIPVVGKEQVALGREMHWIRVDRYYRGEPENPEIYFQPVPCMHCENAPCEVVCPVAATVHSAEGLNDMVYNRCVGTRYCSNNCPYKVRRFNFFLFQDWQTPSFRLMRNPDVSVRSRGVMEKCTYCVQRINRVRIEAEKEDREIRDGEIVTACESACPTQAIVFGNINDPNSRVSQLKAEPRNYEMLGSLNTRPRTTYLGALRNLNPELENR